MNKNRILVTGGAGFIGSQLCEELLKRDNEVVCLDNYYTGHRDNIVHLLSNPNFEAIRHDVTNPISIEVDQIFNMACPASPCSYQDNPIKTLKTSVLGAINMLGIAKRLKCRILQASTSEVYGDPKQHPQSEEYWGHVNCIGIRSCYDEGKRVAETLMSDYHRQNKVDSKIIRIFNTYGPKMNELDGRVVSNFICQALRDQDITIYGSGEQTRSFCFVTDLIDGIIKMMNKDNFHGPVNLGNPNEFTISELAELIIKLTGTKSKIVYKELPSDDPVQRQPDISLARKELGWEPKVQLEEGLTKTIEYFKNTIEI